MDGLAREILDGFPDGAAILRISFRLLMAAVLGAIIGFQRERIGKPAGLRTDMLVSLGAALFVLTATDLGAVPGNLAAVVQGVATGIGFIGGGAILKHAEDREITGLTTAAGIWLTAAIGVAVGAGRWASAALVAILSWVILAVLGQLDPKIAPKQ
jgi:putative Mg2+ transporter-C (MgtC) family protein